MLTVRSPASFDDLAAIVAPTGQCVRGIWMLKRHAAHNLGPSYAVRDEAGRTLLIGGLCHDNKNVREAWLDFSPAAARRMRELVRLAQLTLGYQCHHDPRPVVVLTVTEAGARIARLLGFRQQCDQPQIFIWRPEWVTSLNQSSAAAT